MNAMTNPWWNRLGWLALGALAAWGMTDAFNGVVAVSGTAGLSLASRRLLVYIVSAVLMAAIWVYGLIRLAMGRGRPGGLNAVLRWVETFPYALRLGLALLVSGLPVYLFLLPDLGRENWGFGFRVYLLALTGGINLLLLQSARRKVNPWLMWAGLTMLAGAVFAAGWALRSVTSYPFSLGWSEGNRIWDYSILFGSSRYTPAADSPIKAFITTGRSLLWAVAFLIPGLNIAGFRLWDGLLWVWPALLLGWTLVGGAKGSRWIQLAFIVWTFLFLNQGPIYAPLVISAVLTVLAVRCRWTPLSVVLVMAAAYYARISRWTWEYSPGLWAGMLALLAAQAPGFTRQGWKQLVRPAALGVAGYLGAQFIPTIVNWVNSGFGTVKAPALVAKIGESVSRQPLLWDRLLPNSTYSLGILLGTLWAGLPLVLLLIASRKRGLWRPNGLQMFGAAAVAAAFLVVGVIISTKIGGGSNLHNLDMYWITMLLIGGWALREWLNQTPDRPTVTPWVGALLVLTLVLPGAYAARTAYPLELPDRQTTAEALTAVQTAVQDAAGRGLVLFMDQRQLLTFGEVSGVELISEYEKKYVMDMAMADNQKYFAGFHADLKAHRFALIVSEPLRLKIQNVDETSFTQENNAWVTWVSKPVLTYYEPLLTLEEVGVQLLVPKK